MSDSDGATSGLVIASAVAAKQLSAQEAVATCLDRIESLNPRVNAFTAVHKDRALARAQAVDQQVHNGQQLPLAGVPFAAKNCSTSKIRPLWQAAKSISKTRSLRPMR